MNLKEACETNFCQPKILILIFISIIVFLWFNFFLLRVSTFTSAVVWIIFTTELENNFNVVLVKKDKFKINKKKVNKRTQERLRDVNK